MPVSWIRRASRSPLRSTLRLGLLAILPLLAAPGLDRAALAQTVDPTQYVTNGSVSAQVVVGNTLYFGGAFTSVGPPTGAFATVDAASGVGLPSFPKVAGTVNAIVADGTGGWFIGGLFNSVGGLPRANLAHVLADNSVSPWDPAPNFAVQSLALDGTTLYVGGQFNIIGGLSRSGLATVDTGTGAIGSWNPGAGGQFSAIAVVGGTVYVGGFFTTVGGQARSCIAALDAATGLATAWNPGASSNVFALVPVGGTIYVGGAFTTIGGQPRNRIAALDAATGLATAWNPNATGQVRALAVDGGTVYAGGSFTSIGGQPRSRLAALDGATGLATAWDPNANLDVRAIQVDGGNVYVGGPFTFVGGQQRNRAAALDATTGLATAWNPDCSGTVLALVKASSVVVLGGSFTGLAFTPRSSLAAIDLTTGQVTGWNPGGINGSVLSLASDGTSLYVGGLFTIVGAQTRNRLAEVDLVTGLPTAWDPNVGGAQISAIAVDGSSVFVGCTFTTIGGQPRNRIAEIDRTTGLPTAWNPDANDRVSALAVDGNTVYAGGFFTTIGGQPRNRVAALDRATGLATPWNPNAADGTVAALAVRNGVVYVGGAFGNIGGQPRARIAAIDATTGLATSWNANVGGSNITAVAVSSSAVYVGGSIFSVGADPRNGIAALDPATGSLLNWCATGTGGTGNVNSLALGGSSVFAGGSFLSMQAVPVGFLARIEAVPGLTYPLSVVASPAVGGVVTKIPDQASYEVGMAVEITATPDPGYYFVNWSGDLAGSTNPQTIVMDGAKSVIAHFEPAYTLSVLADPQETEEGYVIGEVLMNPAQGTYQPGSTVEITAQPLDDSYIFVGWSGDLSGTTNPATLVMDGHKSVVAHFEPDSFKISAFVFGQGTLSPRGLIRVPNGGSQTFTYAPAPDYYLTSVIVDGTNLGPLESYTFTDVHADHTIGVRFATDNLTITASASAGGTISPNGSVVLAPMSDQTFTITPDPNYLIDRVVVDGSSVGQVTSYTFSSITTHHTIAASFYLNAHVIEVSSSSGGSTVPSTFVTVLNGTDQTIAFVPEPGFAVADVVVDGASVGAVESYDFTNVTSHHRIAVQFLPECVAFRDDFDGALQPGWEIVRQLAYQWSIDSGRLRIELEYGDLWQNWTNNCRNLFLRPAPVGNFVIEARLDVSLVAHINQAHIVLYKDDDHYLRLGPVRAGGIVIDHVHEVGAGIAQQYGHSYASNSVFLRITVTGGAALMEYSADGLSWTTLGTVASLGFLPTKVGLVAFDGSEPMSSSVVHYDYFSVQSAGGGPGDGAISGTVTATCGGSSDGLGGVTVDLFATDEDGLDVLVASTATDTSGAYSFPSVTPGAYTATLVTPLGYHAATPTLAVGGCGDDASAGAFELTCIPITAQPRGLGYWKHQVNVYLTGKGSAQETLNALVGYIGLIVQHFNENIVNPVIVYVPGSSSSNDQLLQLQQLLTINKGGSHLDRAKQQLLSLLLNVVSAKIHQTEVISGNGATVSQAITYCYDLIVDGDPANDVTAKTIAETINDGQPVPSGMVPIGTRVITYELKPVEPEVAFGIRAVPNPVRGSFVVNLGLATREPAALELIDIAGRRVWRQDVAGSGRQIVRVGEGASLASGVYRLRLRQANQTATRTVVVTR